MFKLQVGKRLSSFLSVIFSQSFSVKTLSQSVLIQGSLKSKITDLMFMQTKMQTVEQGER